MRERAHLPSSKSGSVFLEMSRPLLIDSSFYIRTLREKVEPWDLLLRVQGMSDDYDFMTCGVVVAEVLRGRSDPHVRARFAERFATMEFIGTTARTWERVAELAWTMDRRGEVIGLPDLTIAVCALEAEATVLTFDGHFRHVPGLRVTDVLL
jgi:predicted nucleic acid-binding protein